MPNTPLTQFVIMFFFLLRFIFVHFEAKQYSAGKKCAEGSLTF